MHSSLVRLQNVFGFFTTVAFVVGLLISLSVVVSHQSPSAELELRNVQVVKGRPHYYSSKKEEYAHVKFDLETDLRSLFSWNTKQVFVYVVATFPSKDAAASPPAEAIIWDAVLPSPSEPWHQNAYVHPGTGASSSSSSSSKKSSSRRRNPPDALKSYPDGADPGILRLSNQKPKYQITTPWSRIGGAEGCTLQLRYNVQPWVGALYWSSGSGWGMWQGLQGGVSRVFDMPRVKTSTATKAKDDLKTETGGERNRGSPA